LKRLAALLLIGGELSCAGRPAPVVAPKMAPDVVAARLAEANRLASRGCYLCLKEAASAYAALLDESGDAAVAAKALENNLMIVLRERELRMPDSGALESAVQLQTQVAASYATYFAYVDAVNMESGPAKAGPYVREERLKIIGELEKEAHANALTAYVYLGLILQTLQYKDIQPQVEAVLAAHPADLSVKYRMLTFQPTFSDNTARELIGMETGFGEVHLLLGQRALMGGHLAGAFRELTRARQLLPDSATITMALANVTFSYARYADALTLFEAVLKAEARTAEMENQARLGRAKSLSYLKRHDEAIALLDDLLLNDAANNPGEKYYWRAWNRLQTGASQLAFEDASIGLNAMRNDAIYRLAGMAAFNLNRLEESRTLFEGALQMNRADCDAERYLGLLDSAERSWKPASGRFSTAARCYEDVISRMKIDLAEYEKDITGLSNSLIAGKRAEIQEAEALKAQSAQNAAAALKNAK